MTLSDIVREDLTWWLQNIQRFPSPVHRDHPQIVIYTDASLEGWGAVRDSQRTGGMWSDKESSKHINELELLAVHFGLKALCNDVFDKSIKVMTDNSTAVACINNKGSTKQNCNDIARNIWLWCLSKNIFIIAAHIPGRENNIADEESRKDRSFSEGSLNDCIFQEIEDMVGPFHIDMFASRVNAKKKTYVAWKPDPEAWAIDAFSCEWKLEGIYCFPPFILISRVLKKVEAEKTTVTLIAPLWRYQVWFPQLMRMLIQYPILLPERKDLVVHPKTKLSSQSVKLRLMCCVISGNISKRKVFQEEREKSLLSLGGKTPRKLIPPTSNNGWHFVLKGTAIPWIQM